MSLHDDNILVQAADPVPCASGDMSLAEIDDIERRAKSMIETTAKSDPGANGDTGNESKVACEAGIEAAGGGILKLGSMAIDILSDRVDAGQTNLSNPLPGKTDGIVSGNAQTMDQMIHKSMRGEELVMSANIAESSLRGQDKASVGTWAVNSAKVDGVSLAKRLTFDKVAVHQQVLDSVPGARARYDSNMYSAMQMAPGLGPRPNMRSSEIVAEASRIRFREDGDTWAGEA